MDMDITINIQKQPRQDGQTYQAAIEEHLNGVRIILEEMESNGWSLKSSQDGASCTYLEMTR